MNFSDTEFYSDLAAEEYSKMEAEYAASHRGKPDGIAFRSFCERGMRCEEVRILTAEAALRFGKPRGTYLTLYSGVLSELDRAQLKSRVFQLAKLIRRIAKKAAPGAERILVCGLGNRQMTADAIGPMVTDRLGATLHLAKTPQQLGANALLCAFCPGVVGQTGIETAALCKGAVRAAEPELVIVIDALAAREKERLFQTVQLCDSGLAPGGGVGNRRCAVNAESLGVPVMSIGVPTVIDAGALLSDVLESADFSPAALPAENREKLETAFAQSKALFVMPGESDLWARLHAHLIAKALTKAFSGELIEELSHDYAL